MRRWHVVTAVFQRRADPLPALAHRRVGQAYSMKPVLGGPDAGNVYLNLNNIGVNAINRRAERLEEHKGTRLRG